MNLLNEWTCPACDATCKPLWNNCPFDGTKQPESDSLAVEMCLDTLHIKWGAASDTERTRFLHLANLARAHIASEGAPRAPMELLTDSEFETIIMKWRTAPDASSTLDLARIVADAQLAKDSK